MPRLKQDELFVHDGLEWDEGRRSYDEVVEMHGFLTTKGTTSSSSPSELRKASSSKTGLTVPSTAGCDGSRDWIVVLSGAPAMDRRLSFFDA